MSKLIASSAISGAHAIFHQAEDILARAIAEKGEDCLVGFPDTAYYLPVTYSILGHAVEKLSDFASIIEECRGLLAPIPTDNVWLPYLGATLDAGMATLFSFEVIEACKYLIGPNPVDGIWLGAASDVIIRERGIEFVDGSAPGFAAVVGAAPTLDDAVRIARELQEKNLYVFIAGNTNGVSFAEQLVEAGVEVGWDTRLVPFGKDISAAIFALGFANRAALSFGGVQAGDYVRNLKYNKNRIFAFVIALGEVDEEKYAAAAGAISYGFPTISDTDIPQILPTGICTYEHVVSNVPVNRIVEKSLEVRGCKIKITKVPIPVAYGAAFEGERIRKEQTHVEFGGNRSHAFEYVTTKQLDEVEDGRIDVIGPDVDDVEPGTALPLAIWVEVAGRKMQPDFESILERQIHHLINGGEGVWHMGQRDIIWVRISKAAKEKGFTIRHFGEILHAKLLNEYPAIVDKVQVTFYTNEADVNDRLESARRVYRERNLRVESMTDESVDTFYSCLLCQSFAPNHVCVITPERLGLCGAYNWLDGKAAYEIDPTGPNQPLIKGECLDAIRGQWQNINYYVYTNSKQTIDSFNAYSMLKDPMTSCGCFEAIVAMVPECNGVAIVSREYSGETPLGMKFSTLAGVTGGGQQTPGFIGVGKTYISSRKFISADGGHKRIIWMPSELKNQLREDLVHIGEQMGMENFIDLIADETIGTDTESIRQHLVNVKHPALEMWDITLDSPELIEQDSAKASQPAAVAVEQPAVPDTTVKPAVTVLKTNGDKPAVEPEKPTALPSVPVQQIPVPTAATLGGDGVQQMVSAIQQLQQAAAACAPSGGTPQEQMAALQMSTAVSLMSAAANMMLMNTLALQQPQTAVASATPLAAPTVTSIPAEQSEAVSKFIEPVVEEPVAPVVGSIRPPQGCQTAALASPAPMVEKVIESASIVLPTSFKVPGETYAIPIGTVTIGGSGTRTSAITIGGSTALPFRHFEGSVGNKQVVAMEVFDKLPRNYPEALKQVYADVLNDPAVMAKYLVNEIGADAISIRLESAHPDSGDTRPADAAKTVESILQAVGVPIIVTGPSHFEKNNAVLKEIAGAFPKENLLLNWTETDNYKTIAASAMGYNHCVVAQTPIDVNMAKQLNILMTNMGVSADKIVIDAMTGAIGYGLEYTYSVMERIRTSAFTGDAMLAFPMLGTPGFEVAKTKESKAPAADFPLWGPESERGALLEIATAMSLLNAGADMLILYHPIAAKTIKSKIDEMNAV